MLLPDIWKTLSPKWIGNYIANQRNWSSLAHYVEYGGVLAVLLRVVTDQCHKVAHVTKDIEERSIQNINKAKCIPQLMRS
jgi:hypothetical protein